MQTLYAADQNVYAPRITNPNLGTLQLNSGTQITPTLFTQTVVFLHFCFQVRSYMKLKGERENKLVRPVTLSTRTMGHFTF